MRVYGWLTEIYNCLVNGSVVLLSYGAIVSLQGRWPSIIHKMGGGADEFQFSRPYGFWAVNRCIAYLYF